MHVYKMCKLQLLLPRRLWLVYLTVSTIA